MRLLSGVPAVILLATLHLASAPSADDPSPVRASASSIPEELAIDRSLSGKFGGALTVSIRAEPKTLNPVFAVDRPSQELLGLLHADLIHIDRATQETEPALAKSWSVSADGRQYTLQLRRGLRFSDGAPFTADDVVFSFKVYLDEKLHAPQRDLLLVRGQTIRVEKQSAAVVHVILAEPDAAAERLFDSVAMLPRHLLEQPYLAGTLAQSWPLSTEPAQVAGLGAFRLKHYEPGQRVVLERNPYYWKSDRTGARLPFLSGLTFLITPSEDSELLRFESGETDMLSRLSAENFDVLEKRSGKTVALRDAGPGLEYNFLLLNLNHAPDTAVKGLSVQQSWFRDVRFRQALSRAIDRDAIVRLVYHDRATPVWTQVTPGNKRWVDTDLGKPPADAPAAAALLKAAGFSKGPDGLLHDSAGHPVEFSILSVAGNKARQQIAAMIQQDLSALGMHVSVTPLEFRAYVQRITQTHEYEAAVMSLAAGDSDPNAEMNVWPSSGSMHLWDMGQKTPGTPWEKEIDLLMDRQFSARNVVERKRLYDRVQRIVAEQLPVIFLASPNILAAAKADLGNFKPAILAPYTLHNAERLFWHAH